MKLHANAGLSLKGRRLLVERVLVEGWSVAEVAEAAGVSERTACKWLARFRCEGEQGLFDRSSAPKRSPSRTPEERVQVIAALRRLRMTGAEIAECLDNGALDGLGDPDQGRDGQARTGRDGARCSLMNAAVPASCCISTSRSSGASTTGLGTALPETWSLHRNANRR